MPSVRNAFALSSIVVLLPYFVDATNYVRTAGVNCGTGYAQTINPGDRIICCSNALVNGYDFTLTTTETFAYSSKVRQGASSSTTWFSGSDCDVDSSGQSCSGDACHAQGSYMNDCKADKSGFAAEYNDYWCMHVSCDEPTGGLFTSRGDDCEFDEWTLSFDSASSPSPVSSPSPSPSPPPMAASSPPACPTSSAECDTACDTTNYKNGHSWSSSSSSGGSCTCYDSSMNTYIFNDCVKSSPPPPSSSSSSPPPPVEAESADTSKNCKCECCKNTIKVDPATKQAKLTPCTSIAVGSFDATSASTCLSDICRSKFPDKCPAIGLGTVSSSYKTSTTSSTTSTTASSSGAHTYLKAHISLVVGCFAIMFAC